VFHRVTSLATRRSSFSLGLGLQESAPHEPAALDLASITSIASSSQPFHNSRPSAQQHKTTSRARHRRCQRTIPTLLLNLQPSTHPPARLVH
jgi:hypothetical protein